MHCALDALWMRSRSVTDPCSPPLSHRPFCPLGTAELLTLAQKRHPYTLPCRCAQVPATALLARACIHNKCDRLSRKTRGSHCVTAPCAFQRLSSGPSAPTENLLVCSIPRNFFYITTLRDFIRSTSGRKCHFPEVVPPYVN